MNSRTISRRDIPSIKQLQGERLAELKLAAAVRPCLEMLEQRRLLNGALDVWVNDTWSLVTDTGTPGLSLGDTVRNSGSGDRAPFVTKTFGVDAFRTISAGLEAVATGGTVHVLAGNYRENVSLNKAVTLQGQSPSSTHIRPAASPAGSIVFVRAPNVTMRQISIRGDGATAGPDGGPPTVGLDVDGGTVAIFRATIPGNDIGVRVRNGGNISQMQENFVNNNTTVALQVESTAGTIAAVFNNDLSGGADAITNASATTVDASGNWFGVTSQAAVAALNTVSNVDFTPWLNVGTDSSATTGFQGDFTDVNVGAQGQQVGALGRIQEGINHATGGAGSEVFVHQGTYVESDISVNKALSIDGVGAAGDQTVAPAVADGHLTAPGVVFNPMTHNAFAVRSSNVTIRDLTIDGDAGVGGAGSRNFFGAVVYDFNLGGFNNVQVSNLTAKNLWGVGIYLDGGVANESSGHSVTGNTVMNISGSAAPTGILMIQASGTVSNNTISNVETGIGTNYVDGGAYAPNLIIRGNDLSDVSGGISASGLDGGSFIGGPTAGDENVIDLVPGPGLNDIGIVLQFPVGAVTVQNNQITASGRDAGIWLYSISSANAALVSGNTITTTSSSSTGPGEGTGIFATDDGDLFGDPGGGATFATVSGNTVSGFFRGIDLSRSDTVGFTVQLTINGNNTINNGTTGIRAFDANGTAGANAVAIITGNSASIHGNMVGIDVNGGTATISGNHIYDNSIGVRVQDGGTASLDGNNFDGGANPDNATDLELTDSPGAVTVGSTTPNSFAGDTFFIDDQSTQNIDAINNTFDETNNFRIEDKMHHRVDTDLLIGNGLVTWVANNLYVTDPAGVGTTDSSIQRGIDAASSGDTVNLEAATFTETTGKIINNKSLTILGQGKGAGGTLIEMPVGQPPTYLFELRGSMSSFTMQSLKTNRVSQAAVRAESTNANPSGLTSLGTLTIDDVAVTNSLGHGISVDGGTSGTVVQNVIITDSDFEGNGSNANGALNFRGRSEVSLFSFNGSLTMSDLTMNGTTFRNLTPASGLNSRGADFAFQIAGTGGGAGPWSTAGTMSFNNVAVTGNYANANVAIQRFSSVPSISFTNLTLNASVTGRYTLDTLTPPGVVQQGGLIVGSLPGGIDLSGISVNNAGSRPEALPVNIGGSTANISLVGMTIGGILVNAGTSLADLFAVADMVVDGVDVPGPAAGILRAGNIYVTTNSFYNVLDINNNVFGTTEADLQRAINVASSGDTIHAASGTYNQNGLNVNKSVTLEGAQAGVDARGRVGSESIIKPAVADETLGIVNVTAANVVIDGFTVDGDGPIGGGVLLLDGLTSSNAARGIVVDANNVSVLNNRVQNTYRRGVQFWVNAGSAPIGGLVNQSEFNVIGAQVATPVNSGDAVLAFSDPSVTNNDVNTATTGITIIQVYSPNVTPITISGNDISAINGIALNETSSAIPAITITGNTVNSDDNGIGLQLWTIDGTVNISGNTFTGTGVGDRGVYAWDGTANDPMNVTLTGGSFTGYQTGVHLTNEENLGPFGNSLNDATLTLDGVTITAGSTGVFVEDTGPGTFDVLVNITNDSNISTGGTGTGVKVSGPAASAKITNNDNSITSNLHGVDVDGGTALLQGNNLNGNTIGVLIQNGGIADLGQNGPGTNFTGLGISTGGNDFSGYTTTATTSVGAIVNLNNNAPNNLAGRQGLPDDVPAFNNLWAINTSVGIENVIFHDVDDNTRGFVEYAVFGNLMVALTDDSIDEGGSTTVNGSFTNVATTHTVTVNWGDGSPDTVVNLLAGVTSFSIPSPAGVTYADDPDGPVNTVNYMITVTVEEDASNDMISDNSLDVDVSNVAPTIAVSGSANVNEGSVYTLNLGLITDPGNDTVFRYIINWGDGTFDDIMANPQNTMHTHTYDDGTIVRNVTIALFDEDASPHNNAGNPDPFSLTVLNVAPTATFFNGGAVPEGSNGLVGFAAQFDPSTADTTAGFTYSYDFNNDGDFADPGELTDVTSASVAVPAQYLADGPGVRTVRGRIKDKDGGFNDYTTNITILNVIPNVNAGPNINVPATIPFSQNGSFTDPGADSPWVGKVDFEFNPGDLITDPDVQNLPLMGFNFTLNHTYNIPGTYVIRVYITDKDGATGFDDVTVNVGPVPTFQVSQFVVNTSGFTLKFNRAADTSVLNLYDGLDGVTPSAEPADVTLVGTNTGPVRGSLVWDSATNTATFVRTGGPLPSDTYTLTVRSAGNAWKDTFGALLDGNADNTPGDNFVANFNVGPVVQRTLSLPDFARGPDSASNLNIPNTGVLGLPVRIDDGTQVRSIDFTLNYDPALLNITAAQLAPGMPGDWTITSNLTTPGVAIITVFGTTTDLPAGPQNVVRLVANVPNNAPYTAGGVLRLSNITVSRNDASVIATRGDSAMQKVLYFGDADADRAYTGFDAGLISRVVVGLDTGFHESSLTDPIITADIDGSGGLTGIDASFVAQKAALLPRPEIPDLPGVLPPLVPGGIDPHISGATNVPGRPLGDANMALDIDDATNTLGFNLTLAWDTILLDLFNSDITLGSLYANAGGWTIVTNADDSTGMATIVLFRSTGVPMPGGSGTIINANFHLTNAPVHNQVIPVDVDGTGGGSGLVFTFSDGSILVDAVNPTVLADTYTYQTSPHKLDVQFSEDVSTSLTVSDFVVHNVTTNTTIPSAQFSLSYNSGTNTATLTYIGGTFLPDGNYTLTLNAADVTDAAGNPLPGNHVFPFFFLQGDANHDGRVNLDDFNILAANFGQSPRDFTQGDFDYSGNVNLNDFNILAAQFGMVLGPEGQASPPTGGAPSLPGRSGGSSSLQDGTTATSSSTGGSLPTEPGSGATPKGTSATTSPGPTTSSSSSGSVLLWSESRLDRDALLDMLEDQLHSRGYEFGDSLIGRSGQGSLASLV